MVTREGEAVRREERRRGIAEEDVRVVGGGEVRGESLMICFC